MQLLQRDGGDGCKQHAPDPGDAPADVNGGKTDQGMQTELIPDQFGLQAAVQKQQA